MSGFGKLFSGNPAYLTQEQLMANMQLVWGPSWCDTDQALLLALDLELLRLFWQHNEVWQELVLSSPGLLRSFIQLDHETMRSIFMFKHTPLTFSNMLFELLEAHTASKRHAVSHRPAFRGSAFHSFHASADYMPEPSSRRPSQPGGYMPASASSVPQRAPSQGYLPSGGYIPASASSVPQRAPSQGYLPSGGPHQSPKTQSQYQPGSSGNPTDLMRHKPAKPY